MYIPTSPAYNPATPGYDGRGPAYEGGASPIKNEEEEETKKNQ